MWPFRSKTKKTRSKAGSRSKTAASSAWDSERTQRGLAIAAVMLLCLGIVFGWHPAEDALRDYLVDRVPLTTAQEAVELVDQPSWMSPVVAEELRRDVAERLTEDRLDQEGLSIAAQALAANPWVEEVHRVRRLSDGGAEVIASYREPVAVLEGRDGYFIVDEAGIRLPGVYSQAQASQLGLPLITGVRAATPVAGSTWRDDAIPAGLKLALLVEREPFADQVVAFDISKRDRQGRVHLVMHTSEGQVRWGLPPGEERAIEHPADVKLSWLREVASERGTIDAGGAVVDVYTPAIQVSRMP
ncbi:cell division protein FtsQ/DivIB [Mucisphaera sp.]|uniref:cell division protein FtsQ/DivIB n=1 Tax=Mucisphaera sp. TaxID=2913024 RepID=UPI003D0DA79C